MHVPGCQGDTASRGGLHLPPKHSHLKCKGPFFVIAGDQNNGLSCCFLLASVMPARLQGVQAPGAWPGAQIPFRTWFLLRNVFCIQQNPRPRGALAPTALGGGDVAGGEEQRPVSEMALSGHLRLLGVPHLHPCTPPALDRATEVGTPAVCLAVSPCSH